MLQQTMHNMMGSEQCACLFYNSFLLPPQDQVLHVAEQLVADGFREGASVNGINTDFYGRAIEIADSDDAETEHDEGEAEGGHCSQRRDDDSHHGPGPSTTEGTKQKNQGSKGKRKDKKN
jgi:hypothetical protein